MRAPIQPSVAARALLPLRAFLGAMFVYAGFDKLLDPRFFDPSSAASIQAQMAAFTRVSPIGGLVRIGQPAAVPIGIAIAVAEIAVGLGALTGLAFRVAAWGGAALAALFFLTASWSTHPLYYGPDLPYAAGWITLALTGHGGVAVARRLIDSVDAAGGTGQADPARPRVRRRARGPGSGPKVPASDPTTPLRDRRSVLEAGLLGLIALVGASLSVPFRASAAPHAPDDDGTGSGIGDGGTGSAPPSGAGSAGASAPPSATPVASGSGPAVATTAQVLRTGGRSFTVPFTAPAPLPAGDPAVIVALSDGSFVAFDAVCTHAGCRVEWDAADRLLVCPCHGATFDPARGAAVLGGPTDQPLAAIPIRVDPASGTISLDA